MESRKYKYFTICEGTKGQGGRMEYRIISSSSLTPLGDIAWYSRWRKWCFFPARFGETVWSDQCLSDVLDFMKMLR